MNIENIQSDVEKIIDERRLKLAKSPTTKVEDKIIFARTMLKTSSIDMLCSELDLTEEDLNYIEKIAAELNEEHFVIGEIKN